MSTDDVKAYALKCCQNGLRLDMADLKRSLPPHTHLHGWVKRDHRVRLAVQVDDPREFWDWAQEHWAWTGVYDVHLYWFTGQREPNDQDSMDMQIQAHRGVVVLTDARELNGPQYG